MVDITVDRQSVLICLKSKSVEDLIVGEKLNPRRIQSSGGKVQHSLSPNLASELSSDRCLRTSKQCW